MCENKKILVYYVNVCCMCVDVKIGRVLDKSVATNMECYCSEDGHVAVTDSFMSHFKYTVQYRYIGPS